MKLKTFLLYLISPDTVSDEEHELVVYDNTNRQKQSARIDDFTYVVDKAEVEKRYNDLKTAGMAK